MSTASGSAPEPGHPVVTVLLRLVLPLGLLAGGAWGAKLLIDSAPQAARRPPGRVATLVETRPAERVTRAVAVEAMGEVVPARAASPEPEVAGRVEWVAPELEPGAWLVTGAELVRLDPTDFELAVAQREAAVKVAEAARVEARRRVTEAESALALERGNQTVARGEYERLEGEISEEAAAILLRRPQLESALAALEAAQAGLGSAEAELDAARARLAEARVELGRTTVRAPFNAVVLERLVEPGDVVGPGGPLARLIGADVFWVRLLVPPAQLAWIELPGEPEGAAGSTVWIRDDAAWPAGARRRGQVVRRLPDVDPRGRMARVLVAVDDPLVRGDDGPGAWPLLAGSFVRAEIEGRTVEDVVAVPRRLVRDGDRAWVMNAEGRLEVRALDVLHRGRDEVLVRGGVEAGEALVVTDLATPIEGMGLRRAGDGPPSR